jgi:hypothetical protein
MPKAATIMQHINRATNGGRFRIGGRAVAQLAMDKREQRQWQPTS